MNSGCLDIPAEYVEKVTKEHSECHKISGCEWNGVFFPFFFFLLNKNIHLLLYHQFTGTLYCGLENDEFDYHSI